MKISAAPYPEIPNPIVVYLSNMARALVSARLFINKAVCTRTHFPEFASLFRLVKHALAERAVSMVSAGRSSPQLESEYLGAANLPSDEKNSLVLE